MSTGSAGDGAAWDDRTIRDLLTTQRLRSYLRATNSDVSRAMRLYEWNGTASASVLAMTGMVEVLVRNALDVRMADWAARKRSPWFDVAPLDQRGLDDIAKARDRATLRGRAPEVHGKVIAELSFGFWRYLAAQKYLTRLWIPSLHRAFPFGAPNIGERRQRVEAHLQKLMLVRNRAAHHEPIHRRKLLEDLRAAVEVASWIDADAGAWVAANTSIAEVVRARPS